MRLKEIEARLAAINADIQQRGSTMTEDQLKALEDEVAQLLQERGTLLNSQERRSALLTRIAGGEGAVVRSFQENNPAASPTPTPAQPGAQQPQQRTNPDPYDTPEYRNAFMNYACRGVQIPVELRENAITGVADAAAVVPTTTLQEIIKQASAFGGVYAKVRKLNVQGGVNIPILTLKPTATWIGETTVSDEQKLQANSTLSFSYFGLECKIAQTLLASIVTYEMFQREFVALAVEAIIKALEIGIFTGNGTGKTLGVTVDPRVPAANVITLAAADFNTYDGWKKKVFAKMKKAYRNGIFFMAQGTFDGYIDGMVDANGQPIGRVNYGIEGEEKYRFGGKTVETVEDECIKAYEDAAAGDVVAVFMKPDDYGINSNMQMTMTKWTDNDTNQVKNKVMLICDGKLIDPNGVLIIKKGA